MSETEEHCGHCSHHHELVIRDLAVRYRSVRALEGIRLETSCGNCVALIGPNGAGKSTLLKAIAGLVRKDLGMVLWRGASVARWHREFAYLPQREDVDWSFPLTVRGLVEMGRYPHVGWWRRYTKHDAAIVEQALAAMKLQGLETRQISELSGGQQQRTFIARALAQEPHVLLLDEPFNGLDRNARESLAELLRQQAHAGRLIIASHHDLATVRDIYDQVLILNKSQTAFGPTSEVFTEANLERAFGQHPTRAHA